jgi:predicted TIM-barrel fold metal-dependent hydrolase
MNEYYDAHTHVHVSAQAGKDFILRTAGELGRSDGSPEEAVAFMDRAGIKSTLIVAWIHAKVIFQERLEQALARGKSDHDALLHQLGSEWSAYNNWAAQAGLQFPGRFDSLVGVDPVLFGAQWTRQEIDTHLKSGAVGLKICPIFTGVYPDDYRMAVVWEEANRRGLPVLSVSSTMNDPEISARMGLSRKLPAGSLSIPGAFEEILKAYPRCKVVLAHMSMGAENELARLAGRYPNLYTDTSTWLAHVSRDGWTPAEAADLFRRVGIDRVMFATNYPFQYPPKMVERMNSIPLTDYERRQIMTENYLRVYRG